MSGKTPAQLQAESTWLDCRGTRLGEALVNKAFLLSFESQLRLLIYKLSFPSLLGLESSSSNPLPHAVQ